MAIIIIVTVIAVNLIWLTKQGLRVWTPGFES